MNQNLSKELSAKKAVEFIKSGMILGLGTGSTTDFALIEIANLLNIGKIKDVFGIPTSKKTEFRAIELGIPLTDFSKYNRIDLTIDGADEVDDNLNLIKGGGGALLKEKIVAQASNELIIITDSSKISHNLGEKWAVPIEIIKFAKEVEIEFLKSIGGSPKLRMADGLPFITDEGNYILDTDFGVIEDIELLTTLLDKRAGIVEHGLFVNLASKLIVADGEKVKIVIRDL